MMGWRKWPYWTRGGIISLGVYLFGLFISCKIIDGNICLYGVYYLNIYLDIFWKIFGGIPSFMGGGITKVYIGFGLIFYFILGVVISIIWKKYNGKKLKRKVKKK